MSVPGSVAQRTTSKGKACSRVQAQRELSVRNYIKDEAGPCGRDFMAFAEAFTITSQAGDTKTDMSGPHGEGAEGANTGWLRRLWRLFAGISELLDIGALVILTLALVFGLVLMALRTC